MENVHTLEEEVADAIECVFDHGKEGPYEDHTGYGFDCLEHEYIIPSLEVLVNLIRIFLCGILAMALWTPIVYTGYLDAVSPRSVAIESPTPFTTSIAHHVG